MRERDAPRVQRLARKRSQRGGQRRDVARQLRDRCPVRGLGAANAALYAEDQGASPFRDITQGDNSYGGVTGYQATKGWDPTTGLGSVDTGALVKKLLA